MQRIIAVSDSHGDLARLRSAVALAAQKGLVDHLVFLGDGIVDFEAVKDFLTAHNPKIQLIAVRGNNDFASRYPGLEEFTVCGRKLLATHGHLYHVKAGLQRLCYAAREREAAIALYGHTHAPHLDEAHGILFINPGAICSAPRGYAFAEILIEEDGNIKANLINRFTAIPKNP